MVDKIDGKTTQNKKRRLRKGFLSTTFRRKMSIRGTKEKLEKKLQEGGHREVQETSVYRQREQCKLLSKNKSVPRLNLKLTGHW